MILLSEYYTRSFYPSSQSIIIFSILLYISRHCSNKTIAIKKEMYKNIIFKYNGFFNDSTKLLVSIVSKGLKSPSIKSFLIYYADNNLDYRESCVIREIDCEI